MKYFTTLLLSLFLYSSISAQNEFGIGVNGGVSIPVGDFHKYYSICPAGNAQLIYDVNGAFLLTLTSGYNVWQVDEDAFNKKADEQGLDSKFNLDSHFRMIPIYIGIRYYLSQGKHRPFFSLDFGGYAYEFKLSGTITNTSTLPIPHSTTIDIPETKKTATQTALAVGFGYFYRLSRNWYLEFSSKYNVLSSAYTINEPDMIINVQDPATNFGKARKLDFVSLTAGVNYIF